MRGAKSNAFFLVGANWNPSCPCAAPSFVDNLEVPLALTRPSHYCQYVDDVLALKDVDAVIISIPEHSHSPILNMAVEAGRDAYVEKPMGNVLTRPRQPAMPP